MSREDIMLCYPFKEERFDRWGEALIQPKLNGNRCRAVFGAEGNVSLISSQGNAITSMPHILSQLEQIGIDFKNFELDGELYCHGMPLEEIRSRVGRTTDLHPSYTDISYYIFDVINEDMPQTSRLRLLEALGFKNIYITLGLENIKYVPSMYVKSKEELYLHLEGFMEKGYEGIILRHPRALYERKRSTLMMKLKPSKEDIYEIVGYEEEISIYGEPKNALGALICAGDDGTSFRVGTGYSREQREEMWKNREDLLKDKLCRVKYQEITFANRVPRHSVFVEVVDEGKDEGEGL